MKRAFFILVFWAGIVSIKAQPYKEAVGVRMGLYNGFNYKHFVSSFDALEFTVTTRWRGMQITGMYERHAEIKSWNTGNKTGLFTWYAGAGGHVGFYRGKHVWWGYYTSYILGGIDGILGLEYTLKKTPLSFSLDWKPSLHFIGILGMWFDGGSFSIRYTF